jgi:hypothetical protein
VHVGRNKKMCGRKRKTDKKTDRNIKEHNVRWKEKDRQADKKKQTKNVGKRKKVSR